MANGRTHAQVSTIAAAGLVLYTSLNYHPVYGAAAGLGALSGIALGPDLDQEGISRSEWWIVHKTLGLGFMWIMYWWPYAVIIPHRHWSSHAPVVGTLIRLLYLTPVWLLLRWLGVRYHPWMLFWIGGLMASDALHWLFDVV